MSTTTALHPIVAEHFATINAHDEDAIVATFAADAFVNDIHREFWRRRDPPLGRKRDRRRQGHT